jgi:tight adherence protein C
MLPIIVGIAVGGGILLIFVGLASSSPVDPVQARLTQLGSFQAKNLEELELQQPFSERTMRPLIARMSRMGGRLTSASSTTTAERRLAMAGNPGDLKLTDWMGVKMLVAISTGIVCVLLFSLLAGGIIAGLIFGLVGLGIGYLIPEFWLGNKIKARQKVILKMIPDTLDLLTISVRAGLGFDAALAKVVEKLPGPLTDEFRRALAEVRVGKARRDALRDMIPRTNVAPLSNFIGAIIQAETLGVSISKVLQVQSDQLRIERRQRAEEQAARAPIKMLFPLVGCIFPALFIVILGPAMISIVKTMGSGVIPSSK